MTHPTLNKLMELRLTTMMQELKEQMLRPELVSHLDFEDRLGILLNYELTARHDQLFQRRLQQAKLPQRVCLNDFEFSQTRGISRDFLLGFNDCSWIRKHDNVLISGATGVGKSFLACALAHRACREGFKAQYHRLPRLLQSLTISKADGRFPKVLASLAQADVLILDDWGISPLKADNRRDLLEILEDRYKKTSTIITSQLPLNLWHSYIGDPTLADAILDRIFHNSVKLTLKGESMRKTQLGIDDHSEPDPS